jgi:hypothetical protein
MAEKSVSASRIAEHSGMKLSYVRRVLDGEAEPSNDLTDSFAELLGLDVTSLRRLRGRDRADATLKAKRMSSGHNPLLSLRPRELEALMKRFKAEKTKQSGEK